MIVSLADDVPAGTSPRGRFLRSVVTVALLAVIVAGFFWLTGSGDDETDPPDPDDVVDDDTPSATTSVPATQPPTLIAVPDVVGLTRDEAFDTLRDIGLNPLRAVQQQSAPQPAGVVLRTHPVAGVEVEQAGPVVLIVSTGPP